MMRTFLPIGVLALVAVRGAAAASPDTVTLESSGSFARNVADVSILLGQSADRLAAQATLEKLLPANPAYISPHEVMLIRAALPNLSDRDLLRLLIPVAKRIAPPGDAPWVDRFRVGAAGLGKSGAIYLGVNLSFGGLQSHHGVHAEKFVILNALSHHETALVAMAVSEAPCGDCLQFINELSSRGGLTLFVAEMEPLTLQDLLPHPYGTQGKLLGTTAPHSLSLPPQDEVEPVEAAAVAAANEAYSGIDPSGVALLTRDGSIFKGSYVLIRGQLPSAPPLQAALVSMLAAGAKFDQIEKAVLAELPDSYVQHQLEMRALLAKIAPAAEVRFVSLVDFKK